MSKAVITTKTDVATKKVAQALAKENGFSLSSLIDNYLKYLIFTRHVRGYAPMPMTPKLERLIAQAEKSIERGEVSQDFDSIDDFLDDLHS